MDRTTTIDFYCERNSAAFWAEPLNALSNLSFIIAALWGYQVTNARWVLTGPLVFALLLAGSIGIGIGLFLFHTFANIWSELADVIPIWTFVAWFVFLSIHHIGDVPPARVIRMALITLAIAGITIWLTSGGDATGLDAEIVGNSLNGSSQYAPAVITLFSFAGVMIVQRNAQRWWTVAGALVFSFSLAFRTVDLWVCDDFPLVTHMLWHLLNGVMVALILQGLIWHIDRQRKMPKVKTL